MEDLSFPSFPSCNSCSKLPSIKDTIGDISVGVYLENFYSQSFDMPLRFIDLIPEEIREDLEIVLQKVNCHEGNLAINPLSSLRLCSFWQEWESVHVVRDERMERIEQYLEFRVQQDPEDMMAPLLQGLLGISVLSKARLILMIEDLYRNCDTTLPRYPQFLKDVIEQKASISCSVDETMELMDRMRVYTTVTEDTVSQILSIVHEP